MDRQIEGASLDTRRLQRCIGDLVSLLALPAVWRGSEPQQIGRTLLDALLRMLGLVFIYAQLKDPVADATLEIFRLADPFTLGVQPETIRQMLGDWVTGDAGNALTALRRHIGNIDVSLFPVLLGLNGELGIIVAGSERADFPEQTEGLLLNVGANQACVALQEATLLSEQKRIAHELEQRVTERTEALAQANEDLRNEIVERKLVEQKLRQEEHELKRSEERWRSVFENSAVGVAITDLNGRFIATNPVYQKMLGYGRDELQHLTILEITHEEHIEHSRTLVGDLLDGKCRQFQVEKQYRRKDGLSVWARNNVSIVPGTEGEPRFLMTLSEDITQRKLSEEALAKAESELANLTKITSLGVLTASIAHEINQPLSGIITNADTCLRMLSGTSPNIEGARETAQRTIRDGNRAADIIKRLRTLYSKKSPQLESIDLNEAARAVGSMLQSEMLQKRVTLRFELAEYVPPVLGDRIQLQQVMLNLLRNGAEAMSTVVDRSRDLVINTGQDEDGHVWLSVKDVGIGFQPQAIEKLFQAFHSTKIDGMGIGLSISRSIIEAHYGRLWASLNNGPGATFSFAIPCEPKSEECDESRSHPADKPSDAASSEAVIEVRRGDTKV